MDSLFSLQHPGFVLGPMPRSEIQNTLRRPFLALLGNTYKWKKKILVLSESAISGVIEFLLLEIEIKCFSGKKSMFI